MNTLIDIALTSWKMHCHHCIAISPGNKMTYLQNLSQTHTHEHDAVGVFFYFYHPHAGVGLKAHYFFYFCGSQDRAITSASSSLKK